MTRENPSDRGLWNRTAFSWDSDECIAQVMDRGTPHDWRILGRAAQTDAELRRRMRDIISRVPLPLPHFWLALLASQGEQINWDAPLPDYAEAGT